MKLSRIELRRLIESVVNEQEDKRKTIDKDVDINNSVINLINIPDNGINLKYVKAEEDNKGKYYIYKETSGLTRKGLKLNLLQTDLDIEGDVESSSFVVKNFPIGNKQSVIFEFGSENQKEMTIIVKKDEKVS